MLAQSTAAPKQRPSAGRVLPAEWPSGAAHPYRASSSTEIYDQLQVTRRDLPGTALLLTCHPPPLQRQQWNESSANISWLWSCRSASPASGCLSISCLMHFQLSPEPQFPWIAQRLLTVINPTCIQTSNFIKKGFSFPDFCMWLKFHSGSN